MPAATVADPERISAFGRGTSPAGSVHAPDHASEALNGLAAVRTTRTRSAGVKVMAFMGFSLLPEQRSEAPECGRGESQAARVIGLRARDRLNISQYPAPPARLRNSIRRGRARERTGPCDARTRDAAFNCRSLGRAGRRSVE